MKKRDKIFGVYTTASRRAVMWVLYFAILTVFAYLATEGLYMARFWTWVLG